MKTPLLILLPIAVFAAAVHAASVDVVSAFGSIKYRAPGQFKLKSVANGDKLSAKGRIKMDTGARLKLRTPMGDILDLKDKCYMKLSKLVPSGKTELQIDLFRGKMKSKVNKLKPGSKFQVKTPTAVAGVRGTTFDMEVTDSGDTTVTVETGEVEVRDVEGVAPPVSVQKGQRAKVSSSGKVEVKKVVRKASSGVKKGQTKKVTKSGRPLTPAEQAEQIAAAADEGTEFEEEEVAVEEQEFDFDELKDQITEAIVEELQLQRDEEEIEEKINEANGIKIEVEVKDID